MARTALRAIATGSCPNSCTRTGVPAAVGAELMLKGLWKGKGVFNMEQFDPDPFMDVIGPRGLPWKVITPEDTLEG